MILQAPKVKNTPWGSSYRAAPEILHGNGRTLSCSTMICAVVLQTCRINVLYLHLPVFVSLSVFLAVCVCVCVCGQDLASVVTDNTAVWQKREEGGGGGAFRIADSAEIRFFLGGVQEAYKHAAPEFYC